MRTKMGTLCRYRVVVALSLTLAVFLSAVGCGTNYTGSYNSAFQSTYQPRLDMLAWRIDHDLFNSKYQQLEEEDWGNDWPR